MPKLVADLSADQSQKWILIEVNESIYGKQKWSKMEAKLKQSIWKIIS